ncbi:hypothetical protein QNO07_18980 [Streptomyces sp. 549]|uniref:hypothetical protein n=1 Tax=Streptomyces sp. 549 TaxID=3049076 RepID=UPI0024C249E1|nr:hypothetical protein [Streptomyces sp. 549]MDK1475478.1 hypothetical protein [Streptomyces sp. 549]
MATRWKSIHGSAVAARRPRAAVAAVLLPCLLPLGACSFTPSEKCVPDGGSVSSAEVVGTYQGLRAPKDISLTLEADAELTGASEGRGTVTDWPTGDWYRPGLGDSFDMLSAAADSDRIVLFEDADPDICPRFRLETGKG